MQLIYTRKNFLSGYHHIIDREEKMTPVFKDGKPVLEPLMKDGKTVLENKKPKMVPKLEPKMVEVTRVMNRGHLGRRDKMELDEDKELVCVEKHALILKDGKKNVLDCIKDPEYVLNRYPEFFEKA